MNASRPVRAPKFLLSLCGLALAAAAFAAPATASACGPYGPAMAAEEQPVYFAALDQAQADGDYVETFAALKLDGDTATIWLKFYEDEGTGRWQKFSLEKRDDAWQVRTAPVLAQR